MTAPSDVNPPPQPPPTNGNPPGHGERARATAEESASEPVGAGDDGRPPLSEHRCLELCPICRGAEILRASGGTDLRGGLDDLSREALLTLRALIDHYLERAERAPAGPRVEEIPID